VNNFKDRGLLAGEIFSRNENISKCNYLTVHNNNFMALVRKRTIPTERPPLVDEVAANFCGYSGVTWSARRIPTAVISVFHDKYNFYFSFYNVSPL
jgi:hypothetical protein